MVGAKDERVTPPQPVPPLADKASIDVTHWLLGILLFIIAVAAIVGVVVTAVSGQTTVAIIIALFSAAFFSRVFC
jgi:hypothetical protein